MRRFGSLVGRLGVVVVLTALLAGALPAAAALPMTPDGVAPAALSPQDARTDKERLWSNGCFTPVERVTLRDCVFGDRGSGFTLALVGDSHLSHLFAGFERLANKRGWRLVVYVKASCPFLDIAIRNVLLDREYTECATWNKRVLKKLKQIRPDLTVTLAFRGIRPMKAFFDTPTREGQAIGRMLGKVPGRRVVLVDPPYSSRSIPDCLVAAGGSAESCRIPSWDVLTAGVRTRERAAAAVANATYVDLTDRICGGFPCKVVTNGIVMFRDNHHLTNTYAATLRDALGKAMDRALD